MRIHWDYSWTSRVKKDGQWKRVRSDQARKVAKARYDRGPANIGQDAKIAVVTETLLKRPQRTHR